MATKKLLNSILIVSISLLVFSCGKRTETKESPPEVGMEVIVEKEILPSTNNYDEISLIEEEINYEEYDNNVSSHKSDPANPSFSGGNGSKESPYLISSNSDWEAFSIAVAAGNDYVDEYFLLTQNLSGVSAIIGLNPNYTETWNKAVIITQPFKGTFDGRGHTITVNITEKNTVNMEWGLFAYLKNATVRNLNVSGNISILGDITGKYIKSMVGVICLSAEKSNITNCHNSADISIKDLRYAGIGGICYLAKQSAHISRCSNTGNITVFFKQNKFSHSLSCCIGGVCGQADWDNDSGPSAIIADCYTKGNIIVTSEERIFSCSVGGIIGTLYRSPHSIVKNCFAGNERIKISTVRADGTPSHSSKDDISVHRISGDGNDKSINNCYASPSMVINGSPRRNDNASSKDGKDSSFEDFKNNQE